MNLLDSSLMVLDAADQVLHEREFEAD
jgi:hypothetical protein